MPATSDLCHPLEIDLSRTFYTKLSVADDELTVELHNLMEECLSGRKMWGRANLVCLQPPSAA